MEAKWVKTRDGVGLHYLEGGAGQPLVMVPGWSQSVTAFQRQFADLSQMARVIAIDMRGHGESEKPDHGYRVQRLAKDLFDVIEALDLAEPDLLGHSMGAAVIWSYLTLFAAERPPRRLVFVDEPAALLARPDWDARKLADTGAIVPSFEAMAEVVTTARSIADGDAMVEFLGPMFTEAFDGSSRLDVARENLKLPRNHAATLLEDNMIQDWTELIETIRRPTLVFSGGDSHIPSSSQRWIASVIPDARLEIIPGDAGGRHFLFLENPDRFNRATTQFLTS